MESAVKPEFDRQELLKESAEFYAEHFLIAFGEMADIYGWPRALREPVLDFFKKQPPEYWVELARKDPAEAESQLRQWEALQGRKKVA